MVKVYSGFKEQNRLNRSKAGWMENIRNQPIG